MLFRLILLLFSIRLCSFTAYKSLFETLLARYNKIAFPSGEFNNTLTIEFKLRLDQIVDVHEKDQVITLKGTLIHHWLDYRLSWNPDEFGNITLMHFPGEMLWLPDIILYNNAHGSPWVSETTQVHVSFEGRVTWQPPVVYDAFCNIDIEWYPYDLQICELKFGSWTYGGSQLNLIHLTTDQANESTDATGDNVWKVERGVDLSNYQESVEWDLLSVEGIRHKKWYPCCDYPSIDITYYLHIRRKKLFYTVNMIIPCVCLASMTLWVFYLPCESHQKIQLCISVLVALTLYFLMLIDIIPPTSIVTPLILKYLSFTMIMVALSVTCTVFIQNIHYRAYYQPMPRFVKHWFIEKLGKKLLISRKTEQAQYHRTAQHVKQVNALSAMNILEKQFQKTLFELEIATMAKKTVTAAPKTVNSIFLELPMMNRSVSVKIRKPSVKAVKNRMRRLLSIDMTDDIRGKETEEISPETTKDTDPDREKLRKAEKNIHFIAKTLTDERRAQEAEADWQFVSLVIDRMLLIIFSFTITIGTILTIFSAPTMRDNREPIAINP
ncbi:AcetylCholine Receptor [Caenorhabditis elegans]|uniref:AcetylCholine Receptor n=1 Tax=Caenorhabditis elegans TaxID=6239 RepID=Q9N4M3_CAEEL|nr:AcetylCholine Receptor [Caenorhabditis elegans]CCD73567.2 AcetylCholine Receptor [Caenorhabditis elegans]|eukprot:NP_491354.2 AcetylCholine Receptor [Caenorhabditis elegans]